MKSDLTLDIKPLDMTVDVKPVVLDLCYTVNVGRIPETRVRNPYRHHIGLTLFGTEVLGISGDSLKAQESFRDKHKLGVPLISDEKHQMLEAYGAWGEKSMYGRSFMGVIRTTVLIGADGRIAKIWRNVRVDGHADEVLAAAQGL